MNSLKTARKTLETVIHDATPHPNGLSESSNNWGSFKEKLAFQLSDPKNKVTPLFSIFLFV